MAMLAAAPEGALRQLPDMYMRSIAVGASRPLGIDLNQPVADNVRRVAESFGRQPLDITALVLDRPRHHDLVEELRSAGTRIKLIGDGTVTASISAAIRGTNDHLAIGIGGTRQAVLTAAALRCLGGGMQAQLWPTTRSQIEAARSSASRTSRTSSRGGPRPGDVIVVATGVTNGDLLRGVRFCADSRARTRSSCACAATGCASTTACTSSPASARRGAVAGLRFAGRRCGGGAGAARHSAALREGNNEVVPVPLVACPQVHPPLGACVRARPATIASLLGPASRKGPEP
jgi:fructose-1,6-bisphosphatase/sedoheptulose 1,7-bisphosphatase-like protein